ncbi:MAG: hypothetical protein GXY44_03655 [Phycisphaerales bacterium]|nr:hypothetical protein [Phycisphaerales bacterium]
MTKNKPISARKRAANRRNAQKSTGPQTPEGKAVVSRNAVRHGLLAQHIVLAEDPNENPADFNQLLEQLMDQYRPTRTVASLLVERLAAGFWRLRRALRFEVQSIRDAREASQNFPAQLLQQVTGNTRDPLTIIFPQEANLDRLIRYESMIEREINRILRRLEHLCPIPAESSSPTPEPVPDQPADSPASSDPDDSDSPPPDSSDSMDMPTDSVPIVTSMHESSSPPVPSNPNPATEIPPEISCENPSTFLPRGLSRPARSP